MDSREGELARLFDALRGEALLSLDREGRIGLANRAAERITGHPPGELRNRHVSELYPPEEVRSGKPARDLRIAAAQGWLEEEVCRVRKDGTRVLVRSSLSAAREEGGELRGFALALREAGVETRAGQALRRSQERLARIVDAAADGILTFDPEGRITFANTAAERLLGLRSGELLGRRHDELLPGADDPFGFRRAARTGEAGESAELRVAAGSGTRVLVPHSIPLPEGIAVFLRDVSRERRSGEELARRERGRALSLRLAEVQEAERRRIARELHDEVGQALTALSLLLPGCGQSPEAGEARTLVRELMERVHDLCDDLRPSVLDDLGLLPALLALADRCAARGGLDLRLTHSGLEQRLPAEVETAGYRIVQEALTNVLRHAGARRVEVDLRADAAFLRISVQDDGRGFDPETVPAGTGLSGARDRAGLVGGVLLVASRPEGGTRLNAELPLVR